MGTERSARPWNKRGRDGSYDAIVIGSGMGGMTAAALLAKVGERVLVLEQHYVPGGFTHMFKRPGFEWDVGVHAVGEVTEHAMTGRVLSALTNDTLKWASLGEVYDAFHYPDLRLDFPNTPEAFRANLVEAFPGSAGSVDAYLREVRSVVGSMKRFYASRLAPPTIARFTDRFVARQANRHLTETCETALSRLANDERLKTALTAQWGYYGALPKDASFAIQALVTKHFLHGGFYPVGGAKRIAETLLTTVADAGGWTRISTDVEQIVVERGRAVGVRLTSGEVIRAKKVISAAGVQSTVMRLLPKNLTRAAWTTSVASLQPAPCHVCLYLGFEGDIGADGASAANQWFYNTWSRDVAGWDVRPDGPRGDAPILYCSFPSLKDPDHDPGPTQRHTGEVVTFVPWSVFSKWRGTRWHKRGDAYDAFKKMLHDALLEQFFRRMPQLNKHLVYSELSTPLSTERFTRPVQGSIYGLAPTPNRYASRWLRPKSPIAGLYFGGSEVVSVGVIGAMMGGVLAATAARPLAVGSYLKTAASR